MINKFKGKPFRPVETLKLYDARYHTNQEKAEVLTQYYQSVSSDESLDPEFRQHKNTQEPLIDEMIKNKSNSAEHRTFNAPFTLHELKTALDKKKKHCPRRRHDPLRHAQKPHRKWHGTPLKIN